MDLDLSAVIAAEKIVRHGLSALDSGQSALGGSQAYTSTIPLISLSW